MRISQIVVILLTFLSAGFATASLNANNNIPRWFAALNGQVSTNASQTLHDYVAKIEEKDTSREDVTVIELRDVDETKKNKESPERSKETDGDVVGVKSKKSNAVGDPDDDSDDDNDDDLTEWEDLSQEISQPLQVEVEVVEQEVDDLEPSSSTSGGIGIRLGRRKKNKRKKTASSTIPLVVNTWMPHIYLPPTAASLAFLHESARQVDAAGKSRLDRRTLYSGLLLEFTSATTPRRKYFSKETTQQLQAAVSLATQPQWRSAFPQASGIMLYEPEDEKSGATLSMQETIAMSLVSCGSKSHKNIYRNSPSTNRLIKGALPRLRFCNY